MSVKDGCSGPKTIETAAKTHTQRYIMSDFKEFWKYLIAFDFKTLFVNESKNSFVQLFRYCFVGGCSFIADAALLKFFEEVFHVPYLYAAVIGFIAGVAVNFLLTKLFVFRGTKASTGRTFEVAIFFLIAVTGLGWTELLMWIGVEHMGFSTLLAKAVAAVIVLFWNYGMKKLLLYRSKDRAQSTTSKTEYAAADKRS